MITVFHLVARSGLEAIAVSNTPKGALRDSVRNPMVGGDFISLTPDEYAAKKKYAQVRDAIALRMHGEYVDVAVIDTDDLNVAFELTNTIEEAWVDRRDARIAKTGKNLLEGGMCYSSSVGDLFRNDETNEFFVCAPMGWHSLGDLDGMIRDLLDDPSMELGQ